MVETWISIKELSDLAGVSESSARRYARMFSQFLQHQELGRAVKYHPACANILEEIARLYALGMGSEEIADALADKHPVILDYEVNEDRHELSPSTTAKGTLALALEQMAATIQQLVEQQAEIVQLKQELNEFKEAQMLAQQEVKTAVADVGAAWRQDKSKLEELETRLSRVESRRHKKWWWPF